MSQDTITIIEPNGVERSRPLTEFGLTIGRGGDNDIPLSYDLISRHHTRITFENGTYYVIDLGSANGTYLNNKKLPPNQPVAWQSGYPLRVGQVELILQQTSQARFTADNGGETVVGQFSDDTLMKQFGPTQGKKKSRKWLYWLIGGLIFLCVLIAAGASAYYFLYL